MLRRTLTILAISMLHAGCSTCSIWDECEPGETRSCNIQGCSDCVKAQETCRDNHEWGPCNCIETSSGCSRGPSPYPDAFDPALETWPDLTPEDIAFDLPLDEELDPATDDDDGVDAEDADVLDPETSELPDDVEEDAPEDAGES